MVHLHVIKRCVITVSTLCCTIYAELWQMAAFFTTPCMTARDSRRDRKCVLTDTCGYADEKCRRWPAAIPAERASMSVFDRDVTIGGNHRGKKKKNREAITVYDPSQFLHQWILAWPVVKSLRGASTVIIITHWCVTITGMITRPRVIILHLILGASPLSESDTCSQLWLSRFPPFPSSSTVPDHHAGGDSFFFNKMADNSRRDQD